MKRETYEEFEARFKKTTVTLDDVSLAIAAVAAKLGAAGFPVVLAAPLILRELDPEASKEEDEDEESEPAAEEIEQGYKEGEVRL